MVQAGDKLTANYGAMFPTVYGVVDRIDDSGIVYFYNEYSPEDVYTVPATSIEQPGTTSRNGSPIGVFYQEAA
jgi:hypothetical protein